MTWRSIRAIPYWPQVASMLGRAVLVASWFGAVVFALVVGTAGYGIGSAVVMFAFLRVIAHIIIPQSWVQKTLGKASILCWLLIDALTLLAAGILIVGGGLIAVAGMSSPVLWSGLPGLLAVIAGVHAGNLVASSTMNWKPKPLRRLQERTDA